jgi:hypothetical protein
MAWYRELSPAKSKDIIAAMSSGKISLIFTAKKVPTPEWRKIIEAAKQEQKDLSDFYAKTDSPEFIHRFTTTMIK